MALKLTRFLLSEIPAIRCHRLGFHYFCSPSCDGQTLYCCGGGCLAKENMGNYDTLPEDAGPREGT